MKRMMGWMTLGFSLLGLGALILAYMVPTATVPLLAAAVCWAAGFAWFVKFGRRAKGRMRWVFAASFWVLCADLVGCAAWCVWNIVKG